MEDDGGEYEIEKVVDKKVVRRKAKYLVKWKGYDDSHNTWHDVWDLDNVKDQMVEYENCQQQAAAIGPCRSQETKKIIKKILHITEPARPLTRGTMLWEKEPGGKKDKMGVMF